MICDKHTNKSARKSFFRVPYACFLCTISHVHVHVRVVHVRTYRHGAPHDAACLSFQCAQYFHHRFQGTRTSLEFNINSISFYFILFKSFFSYLICSLVSYL